MVLKEGEFHLPVAGAVLAYGIDGKVIGRSGAPLKPNFNAIGLGDCLSLVHGSPPAFLYEIGPSYIDKRLVLFQGNLRLDKVGAGRLIVTVEPDDEIEVLCRGIDQAHAAP